MNPLKTEASVTVFYDGACPICIKEMQQYQRWAREGAVAWFDITGQDAALRERGIDPDEALMELHLLTPEGKLLQGVDAFILLWAQIPCCRPLAWFANLAPIKAVIRTGYGWFTRKRLQRDGRLPKRYCKTKKGPH